MALNDAAQAELLAKVRETHATVTETIADGPNDLDLGTAVRRLLVITRRSEAREARIVAALEAVTTSLGETGTAILAKVDEALAAIVELDDDLPEGPEVPPTPAA